MFVSIAYLLQHSAETYGGDVVVSPLTAFSALTMFSAATKENTYTQLVDGLGVQRNKARVAKQIRKYYKNLRDDADDADLTIFNRIYVQKSYKLNASFGKLANNQFGASVKQLNFADAYRSAEKVNTFVEGKTNRTIQDVVRPNGDMFSANIRAALVSGAYLHGNWDRPFDKQNSYWGSFNGLPVEFMTTQGALCPFGTIYCVTRFINIDLSYRNQILSIMRCYQSWAQLQLKWTTPIRIFHSLHYCQTII